jgi:hypothetical protein
VSERRAARRTIADLTEREQNLVHHSGWRYHQRQGHFVSDVGRLACAVPRPRRGTLSGLTSWRLVEGVLDALAAKSAIPPILSTLFTARKNAINGSGISYDAPWIVYICLGLSSSECRQRRAQCQSGNYRIPHVRLLLFGGTTQGPSAPESEIRSADAASLSVTRKLRGPAPPIMTFPFKENSLPVASTNANR